MGETRLFFSDSAKTRAVTGLEADFRPKKPVADSRPKKPVAELTQAKPGFRQPKTRTALGLEADFRPKKTVAELTQAKPGFAGVGQGGAK